AAEQVEDVDQGLLPLRARLGVERVQLRRLDGAEDGPQLLINVPRRVSRRGRTPRPQVEASARGAGPSHERPRSPCGDTCARATRGVRGRRRERAKAEAWASRRARSTRRTRNAQLARHHATRPPAVLRRTPRTFARSSL